MKQKRKLRIFISNTFYPGLNPAGKSTLDGELGNDNSLNGGDLTSVPGWELR